MKKRNLLVFPCIVVVAFVFGSCSLLKVATGNISTSFFDDVDSSDSGMFEEDSELSPPEWILGTWKNGEAKRTIEFTKNNVIIRYTSIENLGKTYGDPEKFKIEQDKSDPSSYSVFISNVSTGQNPSIYRFRKISDTQIEHIGASNDHGLIYIRE